MGTIYNDTGGSATLNSGTSDSNSADVTLTVHATYAGGATVQVTVNTGSLTTSVVTTAGATQSAVIFNDATNSNQKIFWITAFDDVSSPKTITVSVAPTGLTAGTSTGGIGGRQVFTSANIEAAVRAGDIILFNNTPASKSADFITTRVNGSTSGYITVRGKTGTRPVITVTNTNQCFDGSSSYWMLDNIECAQQGGSGNVIVLGVHTYVNNVKVSDGGGIGISQNGNPNNARVIACEVTGVLSHGIQISGGATTTTPTIAYSYIHDNGASGINIGAPQNTGIPVVVNITGNIIDSNTARGILLPTQNTANSAQAFIANNSIYNNGDSGLEVNEAIWSIVPYNNIFKDNGSSVGAGAYNVEWTTSTAETIGVHGYNDFNQTGGSAGNLSGITANATEITTDPSFTDAPNGNFSLGSSSPAKGTGFPGTMLGGTNVGYMSLGALQMQVPATGMFRIAGMTGGILG